MKCLLVLVTLLAAAVLLSAAAGPAAATYVAHDKVAEALTKGGPLASGDGYTVSGAHRAAAGQVEVHDKETDIFYITDGDATFITGGTVIGGKVTGPNQLRGTDIQGGIVHHLAKGDFIVIPAGTPHWFKEVPKTVSYYMVKSIKP